MSAAANPVSALGISRALNTSTNKSGNRNTTPYEFESFPDFDSFKFELYSKSYPNLVAFVKSYFSTRKHMFNPLKSLYDPFIQGAAGADGKKTYTDFYEWYKTKNPSFGSNAELYIPEYEIALVQMCRDLLFVHSKGKYILSNNARRKTDNLRKTKKNGILTHANIDTLIMNNIKKYAHSHHSAEIQRKTYGVSRLNNSSEKNISRLLKSIDDKLQSQNVYVYKNFLEILYHFLQIMSCGAQANEDELDSGFDKFMKYFLEFPLLVYPTYMQIDFKNVLLLTASPVINFRLTNRFRFVHDENFPPIGEIEHDILFHGKNSYKCRISQPIYCYNHTFRMNQFITLLKPYFDYNEKDALLYVALETDEIKLVISQEQNQENTSIMNDNQRKVCYCLLLFEMIHEQNYVQYIYAFIQTYLQNYQTEDELISELTNKVLGQTIKLFKATSIFKENNENKASEKFQFLKNIDITNVFLNFIKLLYSLKDKINAIDLTTPLDMPIYLQ